MKRLLALMILALVVAAPPAPAPAATATATLTVSANVIASCTIASQTLTFATDYDGMQNDSGSANVTVTCNTAVNHWIGIDNGVSGVRQMTNGANVLGYQLYRNAARSDVWDNADPSIAYGALYQTNGAGSVQTVYGRIPAGQTPPMGAYSQVLTMTVNF